MLGKKYALGYKFTEEHKKRHSEARIGEKNPLYGKNHTQESKDKMSLTRKGLTCGAKNTKARKVINTKTNEIFGCAIDAANKLNIKPATLRNWLNNRNPNKSSLIWLNELHNNKE